jgi:predicted RNase H-like HicB family nuclease
MGKYYYPAVFKKEDNGFSVIFPDLESCYTQGKDIDDAYEMASDVLCLTLYRMEEEGRDIPVPSFIGDVPFGNDEFVSIISCDTLEYREFFDNKAVKKTLTIPAWLNKMSEREGLNFSAVLQSALKERLHITK